MAYSLISQQSDKEGLSEVNDFNFSEDTGTLYCVYVCVCLCMHMHMSSISVF